MNIDDLIQARATAGARYAAAVAELQAALVDLWAMDSLLVGGPTFPVPADHRQSTFAKLPQTLCDLEHPIYAPSLRERLADAQREAAAAYASKGVNL